MEFGKMEHIIDGILKKSITMLIIVFMISTVFVPLDMIQKVKAHSGDDLISPMTTSPPTFDGNWAPGEWDDAVMVDLTPIAGNNLGSYMYVMNNDTRLFVLYDVFGDLTNDPGDTSCLGFDTNHDGVNGPGDGDDDYFGVGSWFGFMEEHYVYNISAGGWQLHCSNFSDPGLQMVKGFNSTPNNGANHRIFEWSIPFDELGVGPGDTIGFAAGCQNAPGLSDDSTGNMDQWPVNPFGPIPLNQYADLYIGTQDSVDVSPPKQTKCGWQGQVITHTLNIKNLGINTDLFDISFISSMGWVVALYDDTWNPLVDNGGGPEVDTGNMASKSSVKIYVNITIPPLANFGDVDKTMIQANSSNNNTINDIATVITAIPYNANWFNGFETGWDGWTTEVLTASAPLPTNWEVGGAPFAGPAAAYNGTNCSGTNLASDFYASADNVLTTPHIQLKGGLQMLSFYHWYEMLMIGDDGGFVEISVDNGPWNQIWPINGYPVTGGFMGGYNTDGYSDSNGGWEYEEFDLTSYAGEIVQIRFHFASAWWSGGDAGWYIDDVYLGDPPPYRLALTPDFQGDGGYPNDIVDYILNIKNTGSNNDTYDLSALSLWPVTIRDISDTFDITSISINSGGSSSFIVRVSIPAGASPGDVNYALINASSQNGTNVYENAIIETNVLVLPPWFDDMEYVVPWRLWDDGDGTSWEFGDPSPLPGGPGAAYSGTNCSGTNIVLYYTSDGEAVLTSPYFDLVVADSANLTFWHWYDINGGWNDGGWVEVTDDYGNTWTQIVPVGGYPDNNAWGMPCYAGMSGGWVQAEFDLSSWLGSEIAIRFHFRDTPFDGTERPGWYIDDVNVSATYLTYGVNLIPDMDIDFAPNGTSVLYLMTATNVGIAGPDSFDLTNASSLGWTTLFFDLGMNPIASIGPIGTGNSTDFYVQITIPGGATPSQIETSWITATSQNDPSFPPADDTITLITAARAPILLVDDDNGIDTEINFTQALNASGYYYNYWDYNLWGPPDISTLSQHSVVIWFTGNDFNDDTLTPIDRSNLGTYLDNGGRFYFSSSLGGIDAYNWWGGTDLWQVWYQTYLHSNLVNTFFGASGINGVISDPISDGLNYPIHQGDYNINLNGWWTSFNPMGSGVTFFTEPSPSNVAIRADTGTYRIVYTGFDFAGVDGAANRTVLMDRILKWLLFGGPPFVIETTPVDTATGVAIDQNIIVIYSETMNTSVTPTLTQIGGPDPGGWSFLGWSTTYYVNDTATWSHSNWAAGQDVNMSVSGGEDLDANTAIGYLWNFSVASGGDTATATGPISTLTNVAGVTITYTTSGGPASVDIYYTTDTMVPYNWNFIGTDIPADGNYGWIIPADGSYGWYAVSPSESAPTGSDAPEAGYYVYDGSPPWVVSTDPLDMAIGVPIGQDVVITFNESINTSTFTYTMEPNPGGLSEVWNVSNTNVTISHNNFPTGTRIWVNITAAKDPANNNLLPLPYSFYFDTAGSGGNTATATGPTGGPTNVAGITILYSTTGGPATVDLYYTTNTSGPYTWTFIGTDSPADGSYGWTVPADGSYGWYAKSPDEAAPTNSDAPEASYYIYDGTQPEVDSTTPLDMATGVSISQDVIINFNESINPSSFTYTIEPNPGGLLLVWSGGNTTVTISHNDFPTATRIYVNITAAQDIAGNNLNPILYSFYFDTWVTTATATGPTSPPTNVAGITITYSAANNPATVDIYYTTSSGAPYTWTFIGTDSPADGSYGWTVPVDGDYGWFAVSPDESAPTTSDAPESSYYMYDGTPPEVSNTNPANNATGVPVNLDIVIDFNETMNTFFFGYTVVPNPGGLSQVWSLSDTRLTISHNDFGAGTRIWVNITIAEDIATNSLTPLPYSFAFNTSSALTTAFVTGPVGGPINVSPVDINYTTSGGPLSADLFYTINTSAPYTWNLIGGDSPADGSYIWPIPGDGYYGWLASTSDEGPPLPSDAPEASWYIYDGTPPQVLSTDPVNTSIDIAIDLDIVITFNETMNTTSLVFTVEPNPGGVSWLWGAGDTNVTIFHNDFTQGTRIYVNITGVMDLAGNNLGTLPYSFYFDTIIPSFTYANATGPVGGPTNVAGIMVTYSMVGTPATVDLYYTTDTSSPYTWIFAGTDSSVNGSFPWTVPGDGTYSWFAVSPDESAPLTTDAPEASSYIYDGTQPQVSSTDPINTATGISISQDVIITFDETMATGTFTYTIEPNPGGLSLGWTVVDTIVTISHSDFTMGTRYWFNITSLTDEAGNDLNPLTYSFYFETINSATATGPTGGPTNIALITILYDVIGTTTDVDLYYTTDSSAPYTWTFFGNDNPADGSFGWTVPSDGSYGWYIVATDESAPTPSDVPEASYYEYDGTQPEVQSTIPLNAQIDVSINQDIQITFNETMVTGTFTYTIEPAIGGLSAAWSNMNTILTIQHNNFAVGTRYWVNITAATDEATNNLNPLPYSFYFDCAATAAIATGPVTGPTNVAAINIIYSTSGSPATTDLYYTTDSTAPYTWTFIDSDNPADGTYGWTVPADGSYGWFAKSPDEAVPTTSDAPEASYYIYDGTPPQVVSTSPIDTDIDVPVSQDIRITFDEAMSTGTFSYTIYPNPGGLSLLWSDGDTNVTISHNNFVSGTRYWVNITTVSDLASNPLNILPYSFYFDTLLTSATATGPISALTNVSGVVITYTTTGNPSNVDLYYTTNTAAPYTWTFIGNDNPADGNYSWTIPADGTYGWIAVSPNEAAPTTSDAPEALSYLYDGTQPGVLNTDPLNAATGVAIGQNVVITFDEMVNTSSFVYTVEPNPGGLSLVWGLGNTQVTISHSAFATGSRVWINITALKDTAGNHLDPLPYSFYFDTVATAATAAGPTGGPSNVAGITITYLISGSPASVDLYYTTDTGAPYTWSPIGMDSPADGSYIWTIPDEGSYGWFAVSPDETAPTTSDAPEASYYIYDTTSPNVDSTNPVNAAIDILVDQSIIITFSEIMNTGSFTYTIAPTLGSLSVVWSGGDTIVTISHADFTTGTRYWVNVTAASDEAGNDLNPLPYSFYFDIVASQSTATVTGPISSATNVGNVTLIYSTTENPASVVLWYTTDTTSPYTWTEIGTDSPVDGSYWLVLDTEGSYGWYAQSPDEAQPTSTDAPEAFWYIYDTTSPEVTSTNPANGTTGVSVTSNIVITFDEAMNQTAVENAFSFTDGTETWTLANGSISWSGNTMTFNPTFELDNERPYTVTIGSGAQDVAGNGLAAYTWSFTTEEAPDTISPSVTSFSLSGEVDVTDTLSITFSEPMDQSSVESAISVSPLVGISNFSWNGNTLTITFADDFEPGTEYTVTIGSGARDAAGNPLEEPQTTTFIPKEKDTEPSSSGLFLLLLILIIVVILVLLLLLSRRKKTDEKPSPEEPGEDAESVEKSQEEDEIIDEKSEDELADTEPEESKEGIGDTETEMDEDKGEEPKSQGEDEISEKEETEIDEGIKEEPEGTDEA